MLAWVDCANIPNALEHVDVFNQTTVSATFEHIPGATVDIRLLLPGRIRSTMVVQCSTTGGSPATAGWTILIDGQDDHEIQRYLSGSNDKGSVTVAAVSPTLQPGTYQVTGHHRRVTGSSTVNTEKAVLVAEGVYV